MNLLSSAVAAAAQLSPRQASAYRLRLAASQEDIRLAQALRFEVFNLELDEGLVHSYDTGLDADPFDEVCDHLLVEQVQSGLVVGTYRLQTGSTAANARGYYGEREFDFTPFEALRGELVELGRACIHREHRSFAVLNQLWKGIADYARQHGARYLVGCSSLTSQDEAAGAATYRRLQAHLAPPGRRTLPVAAYRCRLETTASAAAPIPRLLSAYLALGAEICGPPAIDREFRTIDFLTCLDLRTPAMLAMQQRGRFTA